MASQEIPNTASPDDISGYDYHQLVYPEALAGAINESSGVPYIVFYINIDIKGNKLTKYDVQQGDEIAGNVNNYNQQNRQGSGWGNTLGNQAIKESGKVVSSMMETLANSSVGGILGDFGGGTLSTLQQYTPDFVSETVEGTTQFVKSSLNAASAEFDRSMKRLKSAIVLYMPHSFSTTYGMHWNQEDNGIFGVLFDNTLDPNTISDVTKSFKSGQASKLVGTAMGSMTGTVAAAQLSRDSNWQSKTGLAPNPRTAQQFSGVDPRSFQFTFTLAAKSREEFQKIKKIIDTFKYYMHPYFHDSLKYSYRLPAEFDIEFYQGPNKNENVNKISSCVLSNMVVDYTPNGTWSIHENGEPTQVNITLQFVEMEILTRERIAEGF